MTNKNLKLIGSAFVYGLTHPYDKELKGRPTDELSITEAILDGAASGFGQGITQGMISLAVTVVILAGIGYVNSKLDKTPVKVKMVVDSAPDKK